MYRGQTAYNKRLKLRRLFGGSGISRLGVCRALPFPMKKNAKKQRFWAFFTLQTP